VRKFGSIIAVATAVLLASGGASTALARPSQPRSAGRTKHALPVLPVNANYRTIKARIDAAAPGHATASSAMAPLAPTIGPSWQGQGASLFSPSDATGAIGPTEYVETVNATVGVYDRTGMTTSANSQETWTGDPNAAGDAEVVYSPHDARFYATMLSLNVLTTNPPYDLIFGFSKSNAPTAAPADWCFYTSDFGGKFNTILPDYPKLGQTADFMLMGVNEFSGGPSNFTYAGSNVAWVSKPAAGTIVTCPDISTFKLGVSPTLKNADHSDASTPVAANETDNSSTGYVVANEDPGAGTSTTLSLFMVRKKATTGAAKFSAPRQVTVASYAYPPSAPQVGTTDVLDTLDARLTNAVAAPDPRFKGKPQIWTQHTVAASSGGLGSEVRWYEIGQKGTIRQQGIVQRNDLYAFMGAISPDRNGTAGTFGSNMVLGFNTSSSSSIPKAQMVSKLGAAAQSGFVLVASSAASDTDFTCTAPNGPPCRWGDYSGASPDPASSATGSEGNVWLSVMLSGPTDPTGQGNPTWETWNWEATP
jgi:hypothetical protein